MSEDKRIVNVVGVRFRATGRVHYFDPGDEDLVAGDRVSAETKQGPQVGEVVIAPSQVLYSELRGRLIPILEKVKPS